MVTELLKLTDGELREKLIELGFKPGPVTGTTRRVYELKLLDLSNSSSVDLHSNQRNYTMDTSSTLDENDRALNKFNRNRVQQLSDRELREQLIRFGKSPGPITKTTRSVYEMLMAKLLDVSSSEALVCQSFEESRVSKLIELSQNHVSSISTDREFEQRAHTTLHNKVKRSQIREVKIDVKSADLRDMSNPKYNSIRTALALFHGDCLNRPGNSCAKSLDIKHIGIVQNAALETNYNYKLNELKETNTLYKEVYAYHATDVGNVSSIIRNNLTPNHPVVHGRQFGEGCYFSEYPEFSFLYGQECMFMFKMLLVRGYNRRHKTDGKGFCEQIVLKDPSFYRPVYVIYF